jgi:hypothetical protein
MTGGPERLIGALLIAMFVTALVNAQFSDPIQSNGSVWLWGGIAIGMSARLTARRNVPDGVPARPDALGVVPARRDAPAIHHAR